MFGASASTLGEIALRTVIVYALVLIGLRATGKRQIGQLTPFDLVVLLLVSNAVQNAMTGPDTSVVGGAVAAATLLIVNAGVSAVRFRSIRIQRFVEGVPVVLVQHGEIQHTSLKHERLTVDELLASLREHEVNDVEEVELAMLEIDGSISVIRKSAGDRGRYVHTRKRLVRHHTRPTH